MAVLFNRLPSRTRRRGESGYWWYLLPIAVGFAAVVAAPFVMNVVVSLFQWEGRLAAVRWDGFGNYQRLFSDEDFWLSFKNSVFMIVAIVVIPTLIGIVLAATLF